ncbi:MAG TPA: acyl-CoA dehydrogenase family protein [Roseiflexaceae bacterium]|nr:acyl-CoA dehydrogenase family protein [Roseiflexaceae bacterium]
MISFTPTEEQQLISDTVRRYAAERLRPAAHDADETRSTPLEVIARCWDLGLLPSAIPEVDGGFGDAHATISGVLAAEELAYGDLPISLYLLTPGLFGLPIAHAGTAEQKERWLPHLLGDTFAPYTAACIEPIWNFDPTAMQTTATRDGDSYLLSGQKAYVPLAADAAAMLIYAREGQATQIFIVERGSEGLEILDREQHMGLRALPTYGVRLEDVRVPAAARLGGGQGIDSRRLLDRSRVALGALAVGVARAAYEYAREYALQREAFGKPIAQNQALAFMLAEMAIEIDAARLMTWEAAWQLDQQLDATRQAVLARQYADEAVLMVADRAVQILGGHGYIREHPVERWLREARGFTTILGMAMV